MLKKQVVNNRRRLPFKDHKIAVVVSLYNREFTHQLEKKCLETLQSRRFAEGNIEVYHVPGAFEIPLKCQELAKAKRYQAIITLGLILKGDTYHFELVADECARGVMQVMLKYDIPIIFEVLACYDKVDAVKRCGDDDFNRGIEAAQAVLKLLVES